MMNRWVVVAGAVMIQLCLGAIFAWSAFTGKLTEPPFGFTKTQTQVIFSTGLLTFALTMALLAGRWQQRFGPRRIAMLGGAVLGLGYVLAGLSGTNFWGILLGVGLLAGMGIGLAYVCPIVVLVNWFPDKKGFITGLAVMGFGLAALIWIKMTTGFDFGPVSLTPGWRGLFGMGYSVSGVFMLYGAIFAVGVFAGAVVMVNPPAGWTPVGWHPDRLPAHLGGGVNFTVGQMVRTGAFWILFAAFAANTLAGLMVIGIIKLFGMDALTARGILADQANAMTGTAMGVFYALCNALGRVTWGGLSDKIGRRGAISLMSGGQAVMMVVFYFAGGYEWGLYLGAALIGFNFGGNFALFPAATADLFGDRNVGTNYPLVYLAYGVGGLVGPTLGGVMGDAKAWMWAFIPAGVTCLAVAVLATRLRPPQLPTKT